MNPAYPITEFEIQAVAYYKLRSKFRYVRGELPYKNKNRFDIILFDVYKKPALVIEVKSPRKKAKTADEQVITYNQLTGAPVMVINQMHQAEDIISFLDSFCRIRKLTLNLDIL